MKSLPYETTNQPDAIERLFCVPFSELRQWPMDEETSKLFLTVHLDSLDGGGLIAKWKTNEEAWFIPAIIQGRGKWLGIDICDHAAAILSLMCDTPGTAVMYAHYVAYKAKLAGVKEIDTEFISTSPFPMGFPSDKDMHELWNAQKVECTDERKGSDNLLDYSSANVSISQK